MATSRQALPVEPVSVAALNEADHPISASKGPASP